MSSHLNYELGSPISDHQPIWGVEEGLRRNPIEGRILPVVADIKKFLLHIASILIARVDIIDQIFSCSHALPA